MHAGNSIGRLKRLLPCLFALTAYSTVGASELAVQIHHPPAGEAVFGEVEVRAELVPSELALARNALLEIWVDGRFAGRLDSQPWHLTVDVGEANAEHRFELVARANHVLGAAKPGEVLGHALLITPAIRVDEELELSLKQLYVTVGHTGGDHRGERILDLDPDELVVEDDGAQQRLVTFERGEVPLTALLLIDASASMEGRPLDDALGGARAFLTGLRPLDRAKILLFSDRVLHTTPFTGFAEVLGVGLDTVEAAGGTALNDHLYFALRRLDAEQGRRVLILLSDGVDVASALTMDDVSWVAQRSEALVYWIRPGSGGGRRAGAGHFSAWRDADAHRRELRALATLVERGGGRVLDVPSIEAANEAFGEILRELREQYVLGYYPTTRRGDGSWHSLRVKTRRSGARARFREGYWDE